MGGKSRDTLEGFGVFPSREAVGSSAEAPAEAGGAVLKISSHLLKFFLPVSSSFFLYCCRRGEQVSSVNVIISPSSHHLHWSHQRADDGLQFTGLQLYTVGHRFKKIIMME